MIELENIQQKMKHHNNSAAMKSCFLCDCRFRIPATKCVSRSNSFSNK